MGNRFGRLDSMRRSLGLVSGDLDVTVVVRDVDDLCKARKRKPQTLLEK
jgi:hypothetical protein